MTRSSEESSAVAEEVPAAERRLLLPEVRSSRSALEALLHPDFREIGASTGVLGAGDAGSPRP